jgi:hypothetical protein
MIKTVLQHALLNWDDLLLLSVHKLLTPLEAGEVLAIICIFILLKLCINKTMITSRKKLVIFPCCVAGKMTADFVENKLLS